MTSQTEKDRYSRPVSFVDDDDPQATDPADAELHKLASAYTQTVKRHMICALRNTLPFLHEEMVAKAAAIATDVALGSVRILMSGGA